jgi:integrase
MALTAVQVKAAKPGERLLDGKGLRLDVDAHGNKAWILRFTSPTTGKERYMGLGSAAEVALAEARERADEARALVRKDIDPIDHRNASRATAKIDSARAVTFKAYAEQFIGAREGTWKNAKHRQQWRNSLRDHAYPHIGTLSIPEIDTDAVLKVLRPIWLDIPESAGRVRGRIEVILNAAKAQGLRSGENPALWRGHLDQILPKRRKKRDVKHHPALPYAEHPRFMGSLRADESDSSLALQFTILTAARYVEGAKAEWSEIDTKAKLWTVPAERMKGGRVHVVPLSDAALQVLKTARERTSGSGLVFPGMKPNKPLSDVTFAKAIKRHTNTPATTHGFRSTFRDWAGDMTNFPRDVCEQALAHTLADETEAAYRRSDALAKRRLLMDEWAAYCSSTSPICA